MPNDPWRELPIPNASALSAVRIVPELPWNIHWARGADGHYRLLIDAPGLEEEAVRVPTLRGIDARFVSDGERRLMLRLVEDELLETFAILCGDLVSATRGARDAREAAGLAIRRTIGWHRLLRGGSPSGLSVEEQQGLVAELSLLDRVRAVLPAGDAVRSWQGPLGAPKDFEFNGVAIECKAHQSGARAGVAISSEHQLDQGGLDMLVLCTTEVNPAGRNASGGVSVNELVANLGQVLRLDDLDAADEFERRVGLAGVRPDDDGILQRWQVGRRRHFHVTGAFPRIIASQVPVGVRDVRYTVDLAQLEPFAIDEEVAISALAQGVGG